MGAAGGAQVSAGLSYYEWLKTQPASFQDAALGPVRAQLFRNGGLTSERFAALQLDKNFRPLSLDQLRELEPEMFRKAGIDDRSANQVVIWTRSSGKDRAPATNSFQGLGAMCFHGDLIAPSIGFDGRWMVLLPR